MGGLWRETGAMGRNMDYGEIMGYGEKHEL